MPCSSCAKPYSLLRKEKGCPGCGFGYCSSCLNNKIFVPKLNTEAKVCLKCKNTINCSQQKNTEPPDAYYKRINAVKTQVSNDNSKEGQSSSSVDQLIQERLIKLKEGSREVSSTEEITRRLQQIKGTTPPISDEELLTRLAKLKGLPISTGPSKNVLPPPVVKTEQEQADDLLRQVIEKVQSDNQHEEQLNNAISEMENRLQKLKGTTNPTGSPINVQENAQEVHSEDEEDAVRAIVERVKAQAVMEDDTITSRDDNDELPFCEICNEDAKMRCLGCKYLFCKRCFMEHKDDDDGCNKYESYNPPKNNQY